MRIGGLLGVVVMVASATLAFAAEPKALPGSVWTLELPDGYTVKEMVGPVFQDAAGHTIVVVDTPVASLANVPHPKVGDVSNPGTPQETKIIAFDAAMADGKQTYLMQAYFPKQKTTTLLMVVEGKGNNGTITTQIVDSATSTADIEGMRKVFATVKERTLTDDERLSILPFTVKDHAGLRLVGVVANSIAVFTNGPSNQVDAAPDQLTVSAMLSPKGNTPLTLDEFAVANEKSGLVKQLALRQFPDAVIGAQGREKTPAGDVIGAHFTYKDKASGKPMAGFIWVRPAEDRLLMMFASHPDQAQDMAKRASEVLGSVAAK